MSTLGTKLTKPLQRPCPQLAKADAASQGHPLVNHRNLLRPLPRSTPTWTCDQLPPRAVGTLRAFKAAARAARLLTPLACSSRTIGMTLAANWSAAALTGDVVFWRVGRRL